MQSTETPKREPRSALERAFIARVLGTASPLDVQENAFTILSAQPGIDRNLLVAEAMLSHRLNRRSPLYTEVGEWMKRQENKRVITGIALRIAATWPIEGIVDLVWEQILLVIEADPSLREWLRSGDRRNLKLGDFLAQGGVDGPSFDISPRQDDLVDECRRLMDPASLVARSSIAACYLINGTVAERMPALRQTIVDGLLIWPSIDWLLERIVLQMPIFLEDLVQLVTQEEDHIPEGSYEEMRQRYEGLFKTTAVLVNNLKSLPDEQASQVANRLSGSNNCWLLPSRETIYATASDAGHQLLFAGPRPGFHARNDDTYRRLHDYVDSQLGDPSLTPDLMLSLPATKVALAAAKAIEQGRHFSHTSEAEAFKQVMKKDPGAFIAALRPVIRSGKITQDDLVIYLDAVGLDDRNREDARGWLLTEPSSFTFGSNVMDLVQRYVIPNNLPAGRLFLSGQQVLQILDIGYPLKAEDISEKNLRIILEAQKERSSRPGQVWEDLGWSRALLTAKVDEEMTVRSLLKCAHAQRDTEPDWLKARLSDDLTEEHPNLRRVICEIALGDREVTSEGAAARAFLLERSSWYDQLDPGQEKRTAFVRTNWSRLIGWEPKVADAWISEDKQYELVFGILIEPNGHLTAPGHCPLFNTPAGKIRLTKFLLTQMVGVNLVDWLTWVSHYRLTTDSGIRNQINRLVDHHLEPVRKMAMSIRRSIYGV